MYTHRSQVKSVTKIILGHLKKIYYFYATSTYVHLILHLMLSCFYLMRVLMNGLKKDLIDKVLNKYQNHIFKPD